MRPPRVYVSAGVCDSVNSCMLLPLFFYSHPFWNKKIKQWRSVGEQTAKYSRCVHVRARLSRTTSPALTMPCNWGENKDRNYMFIFDNNFNLLRSPSEMEAPTERRWESLPRLKGWDLSAFLNEMQSDKWRVFEIRLFFCLGLLQIKWNYVWKKLNKLFIILKLFNSNSHLFRFIQNKTKLMIFRKVCKLN